MKISSLQCSAGICENYSTRNKSPTSSHVYHTRAGKELKAQGEGHALGRGKRPCEFPVLKDEREKCVLSSLKLQENCFPMKYLKSFLCGLQSFFQKKIMSTIYFVLEIF